MKKVLPFFILTLIGLGIFFAPVHAQDIGLSVQGQSLGAASGLGSNDVRTTAVQIINVVLGLLGIICVSLIVYAGYMWMTSGGSEDKIESAQKTIKACVLGLLIILSAWSITTYVLENTNRAATGNVINIYP